MNLSKMKITTLLTFLLLALLLGACSYTAEPVATSTPYVIVITFTPTVDMGAIETQVVGTFSAQLTETAVAMPTETPIPPTETVTNTETPTVTKTPYPTNTYIYWTATPNKTKTSTPEPQDDKWNCKITFQLVENKQEFNPNEDFDARWTIKNNGSETWNFFDVDYRYMSGTEMQTGGKVYDLPDTITPDESITITVDMKAPGSSGYYETFWALARHADGFCSLPTRIKVK
ncbi:MAG: hypothetical protein JEZ00_21265 [Anaerolineaceae bacterium]|nr:hypothetical protein [Anaerolineaceae bacterium]